MSRSIARARAGRESTSLYQEITHKIITVLEAGRVPWVQSWGTVAAKAPLTMPKNAATHRHYSGINVLILWGGAVIDRGFSTQNWLTFRQALRLGGNVRKGDRGTPVRYADHFVPDEERLRAERDGGEPNAIRFLKRFTVFNTDQCEDLDREVHIARILSSESTTHLPDQAIPFTACDALGHDTLQKAISRARQIDHWLASDFDGTIIFDEGDEHAAGEDSECRAHDNLNAIPLAVSAGDKAAA